MPDETKKRIHQYFVDEAGDLTLFNKKGQVLLGREGVSNYFLVGALYLPNPTEACKKVEALRLSLLADPYFKDVPSMQPTAKKNSYCLPCEK